MAERDFSDLVAKLHQRVFLGQLEPLPGQEEGLAYPRVSDRKQEKGGSIEEQVEAMLKRARVDGRFVRREHVFIDVHQSDDLDRPALLRLLETVETRRFKVVYVYVWDRWSRKQSHAAFLEVHCNRQGAQVVYLLDEYDDSPEGRLFRSMKQYVAEQELLNIRRRVLMGINHRVKDRKPPNATRPPLGLAFERIALPSGPNGESRFDVVGYRLVAPEERSDPFNWRFVRMLADKLLYEGFSLNRLALWLDGLVDNEDGHRAPVPTARGGERWNRSTLRKIILNPVYEGRPVALRQKVVRDGGKRRIVERRADDPNPPQEIAPCPPIITDNEATRLRDVLGENKAKAERNNRYPTEFLLRGPFAACGYCNARMLANPHGGSNFEYVCPNNARARHPAVRIPAKLIDGALWSAVERVLRHPDVVQKELANREPDEAPAERLKSLDATIGKLTREMRVLDLALNQTTADYLDDDGNITDEESYKLAVGPNRMQHKLLAEQKKRLFEDRNFLDQRSQVAELEATQLDRLTNWCEAVAEIVGEFTYAERRAVLSIMGMRAVVWDHKHADPQGKPNRFEVQSAINLASLGIKGTVNLRVQLDSVVNGSPYTTQSATSDPAIVRLRWRADDLLVS